MNQNMRIFARIRKDDELLKKHFQKIPRGDWAHEARRLMKKSIRIEQKEKKTNEYV